VGDEAGWRRVVGRWEIGVRVPWPVDGWLSALGGWLVLSFRTRSARPPSPAARPPGDGLTPERPDVAALRRAVN
jgi:hypothetical protein